MTAPREVTPHRDGFDFGVLRRRIFSPISIAFVVLALFLATKPPVPGWVIIAPFAVSVLVFGLPHGALDHLMPARLAGRRPSVASIACVCLVYLLLAAAVLLVWKIAPATAFLGFIALTWFHWGQGDLWIELAEDPHGRLRSRTLRAGTVFVRGGLPMLLPLLFHPATYAQVRLGTVELFGQQSSSARFLEFSRSESAIVGIVFALIVITMAVLTWRTAQTRGQQRAWAWDQAEIAVLALFFALGPPILTVGLYFCLWHSIRHMVRLELLDPRGEGFPHRGEFVGAARRFAVDAAPITAIAVLFLGATYVVLRPASAAPEAVVGPYLVLISALTVPHVAIVVYMDMCQGVWTRDQRTVWPIDVRVNNQISPSRQSPEEFRRASVRSGNRRRADVKYAEHHNNGARRSGDDVTDVASVGKLAPRSRSHSKPEDTFGRIGNVETSPLP